MKFWDSSAIVALSGKEQSTDCLVKLFKQDAQMVVWWGTGVECSSAVCRLEREGVVSAAGLSRARHKLNALSSIWQEIQPTEPLKELSCRLLRVHALKASDALQLAAAIVAGDLRPSSLDFVCLDERLSSAAQKEGFNIIC